MGGDPAVLNASYPTIQAPRRQAILECKLFKYLGLARTAHPGIQVLGIWAWAATCNHGIQAISVLGLGGDPAILEYKLSRHLGFGRDPAVLEYKLSKYLGLAATSNPGIQVIKGPGLGNTSNPGIQTIWAWAGTQQFWNTTYLGTWAWQNKQSWNTSYLDT